MELFPLSLVGAFVKRFLFLSLFILLNGCMGMGMHGMCGMEGMKHNSSHEESEGTRVIKEVRSNNTVITAEVPPLFVGEESTITLEIQNIPGAKVSGSIRQMDHSEHQDHASIELQGEEREKGIYHIKYRFEEAGLIEITIKVWREGDESISPIVIPVTQEVRHRGHSKVKENSSPSALLGGLGMVSMIAIMAVVH